MSHAPAGLPTKEDLEALIAEVEAMERLLAEAHSQAEQEEPVEVPGDPCPGCGAPSLDHATCVACDTLGCLPRDDWMPGMADPCLTRCVRCAFHAHLYCCGEDHSGNYLCGACRPLQREWDEVEDESVP